VVTLLGELLLELLLEVPLEVPLELSLEDKSLEDEEELSPEEVVALEEVAGVALDAIVVAVERLASAGSWPETSTSVIISQAATNSASDPAMTRRRIDRARAARSVRSACPRARAAAAALVSLVMSCTSFSVGVKRRSVCTASDPPVSTA
jgi:hypothetical protein